MISDVILLTPLFLQLIGFTFAVMVDSYISREHKKFMMIIVVLIFSLIVRDYTGHLMDSEGTNLLARIVVAIYGYSVRPLILVLLCYVVSKERKEKFMWGLVIVNAVIYMTALVSDICFSIDENNYFRRGILGYSCHIVSGILLFYLTYLTIREFGGMKKAEAWIPIFNVFLIIASVVWDSVVDYRNYPVTFLTIATVSSNVFYYIWFHLQFVREHEQALMAEQRIQIMMSQIQPHFLYNTLSTIQALCRVDPEKAFYTTEKFGTYLRQNIDSLDQPNLISIGRELEHTKIYAEIEMIRFPKIHVEYDIRDEDFLLPALTVQPLVENAIRHGVRIRENGHVLVTTQNNNGFHEIIICDNGKGFDTQSESNPNETHIGIKNVRERIEKMCGGTVTIESRLNEGTTVTIRLPLSQQ